VRSDKVRLQRPHKSSEMSGIDLSQMVRNGFGHLTTLCGDIGNVFVNALAMEKVWSRAGLEFGDQEVLLLLFNVLSMVCALAIMPSMHTLLNSFASWDSYYLLYVHVVWMCLDEESDGYDNICTHVDEFKIVMHNPSHWLDFIKGTFLVKSDGPPSYFLGNDYNWSAAKNTWVLSSIYIKECSSTWRTI